MGHTVGEWAQQLSVAIDDKWQSYSISTIAFDSRSISSPATALFVALKTADNDGHHYIAAAYDVGVRIFLVANYAALPAYTDVCWLQVADPLRAMQQMVAYHRRQFSYPVIGITGSNGKTTVKEWLYQLLSHDYAIVRTPKSYNSQIGVPLAVWQMAAFHNLALFEAGLSQPDEMAHLEAVIQPTIGVFTTIGPAHDEGFSNRQQKIGEKLRLFRHVEQLVYCLDHSDIASAIDKSLPATIERLTWGSDPVAQLQIVDRQELADKAIVTLLWQGEANTIECPFTDKASLENVMHCIRLLLHFRYDWHSIQERIRQLHYIPMRLELKQAHNNSLLIYDCYNSDVKSLDIALDFLTRHHAGRNRVVLLSDIVQTGVHRATLYTHIAQQLAERKVDFIIGVGPDLSASADLFPSASSRFFDNTQALIGALDELPLSNAAILLKGARQFAFEQVGELLEQKHHATIFEINLNALAHNLKQYKQFIPSGAKIMAMVKAFSYGAGSYEIASILAFHQADYLAVAYIEEGVALREARISLPIMVLNPDQSHLPQLWRYNLEPEVYSVEMLQALAEQAQGRATQIHLMWDTGMHRLGLSPDDLPAVLAVLQAHPELFVVSQLSHLVGSDNPIHDTFTRSQADRFVALASQVEQHLPYTPMRHLLNSGGITRFPEYAFDMVRLGLGLYGLDTTGAIGSRLQPVGRLKTVVSQIRTLNKGESIGYNRAYVTDRQTVVATVAIGYADGYRRAFSNGKGYLLIHGEKAPVVGQVCMDLTMVDVTDIPGVAVGDEAIVFGPELPVEVLAAQADTIPYDIITGIDQRVKRIYIEE